MSEAKFTPAPWVIIKQDYYEAIDNDELNLNVCTFTSRSDDTSHDQNLIAAAPKMYEMLEKVAQAQKDACNEIEHSDSLHNLYGDIELLLSKARG